MFDQKDLRRDQWMLTGKFKKKGYDWWWHSFTAIDKETKEEVPFFVEFYTINPGLDQGEPILGQDPKNQGKRPTYLMIKCGCWGKNKIQLHRFYSFKDVTYSYEKHFGFQLKTKDALINEHTLKGHVIVTQEEANNPGFMCDAGEMSFDLHLEKKITFNVGYGANGLFRFLKAFEMYWHAEGIKTLVSGKIVLNGREYEVIPEASFGYADKNWGCDFTTPWVWLASSDIVSRKTGKRLENSAFDIGGGRPKAFHIALNRKLLGVFNVEGNQGYEFNFAKFWMGVKTKFSVDTDAEKVTWHIVQRNHHYQMETDVTCLKKDMLLVQYENPLGEKKFKTLYNGGNGKGEVRLFSRKGKKLIPMDTYQVGHVGCEYGEYGDWEK